MSPLPLVLATLLAVLPCTFAVDKTSQPAVNSALKLAATNLDRHNLLESPDNSAWRFNFNAQPNYTFTPGSVVNANAATFPALTGTGMTVAMLNLGPCAMLPPHAHPRATNLVVAVTGNTTSWMVGENGVKTIQIHLVPGILTIFPRGSLHAMQNNGCESAQLVSALDSEDTGTLNYLNGLYQLPHDMIRAAFGDADLNTEDLGKRIPPVGTGSVLGSQECLKRCSMIRK